MDIEQLKLVGKRVRRLLNEHGHELGHSKSLDLVAAIPGLRNWPEVQAFPERVAAATLPGEGARRLRYRIDKTFGVDVPVAELCDRLAPVTGPLQSSSPTPTIWPSGPAPGVYITSSPDHLKAAAAKYLEATDGALYYAEGVVGGDECIELGDEGLYSPGLQKLPSGTLIAVGPVQLAESRWESAMHRIWLSCQLGDLARVVVYIDSPDPETIAQDVELLAAQAIEEGLLEPGCESHLAGPISADGELLPRQPFAAEWPAPVPAPSFERVDNSPFPASYLDALASALREHPRGLYAFSSDVLDEVGHGGIEMVATALRLAQSDEPVARIRSRPRSTPEKDRMVVEPMDRLPIFSSVASAYARGYRRFVGEAHFMKGTNWWDYLDDCQILLYTFHGGLASILLNALPPSPGNKRNVLTALQFAAACIWAPGKNGPAPVLDAVRPDSRAADFPADDDDAVDYLYARRFMRQVDELAKLLEMGEVTGVSIDEARALPRGRRQGDQLRKLLEEAQPA